MPQLLWKTLVSSKWHIGVTATHHTSNILNIMQTRNIMKEPMHGDSSSVLQENWQNADVAIFKMAKWIVNRTRLKDKL